MNVMLQAALRCYYDTNRTNIAFMRPQHGVIVSLYETRHLDALCYTDPAPVISPIQSPSAINGDPHQITKHLLLYETNIAT
jgi:hypothetical protein